ncbi:MULTISPECIES: hypothetical protein [unclassified Algibacter]|uniref:hypothetical protein n=1 Tax=unclassified Algibacter TaxID=2615009 RepID=UPI00131C05B2|nr:MULTISPECIES: hypothetical protein [unclassified Algibacter]MCL5129237.1 hypothetical protein [Algibacter sp. L4_22]
MDEYFAKVRVLGKEEVSLFANPMFVDLAVGNFSFKDVSSAIKISIPQLDVSKMGMTNKK